MKATSTTTCTATYSPVNALTTTKGEKQEYIVRIVFFVIFGFVAGCTVFANNSAADEPQGTKPADILKQDVVRFAGPMTAEDAAKPNNSDNTYVVRINAKSNKGTGYGFAIGNVDIAERALLDDAADGKWDNYSLFRSALIAEGVRDLNQIQKYENRINSALSSVAANLQNEGKSDAASVTKELFNALHRELLTKPYNIDCTTLSQVFETGHFNCVSATVLFNVLSEKAGLDVCALEMPGHALSRVKYDGQSMNLETTAPNWFSLQNEEARKQATLYRVARPVMADGNPEVANAAVQNVDIAKTVREITPVQLIATIYYNKGVDYLNKKMYAEAIAANVKALHLDPNSETAWGNLLAAINNWAIEMTTDSKRYDLAATLLEQGVYLDKNYEKFNANQLHTYYNWMRDLALEGRTADAQTVYNIADQRLPNNADLAYLMQAILKNAK
ncbi:MAG: tetratricopeptide repeat protein [Planctomycetaceae bacterium]|nr:tetratricopeptide repeat protein [Planctomycetaceae bacterium]